MKPSIDPEEVWKTLSTIPDPEFGVGIVDLGLIYDVRVEGACIHVAMTLTTPSCPAGSMIFSGVKAALEAMPGVEEAKVELVWEPRWTTDMITAAGREHLGWAPAG